MNTGNTIALLLHGDRESAIANHGAELLVGYRNVHIETVAGRVDGDVGKGFGEAWIRLLNLVAPQNDPALKHGRKLIGIVGRITNRVKFRICAIVSLNVNFHIANAIENRRGLRELARLRQKLMERKLRVGFVEHRPYHAVAVGSVDQRIKLRIVEQAFGGAEVHINEIFENVALAERCGIAVKEEEENVRRSGAAPKSPERVTVDLDVRELLRSESRLCRVGRKCAKGDAGNL